MPTIPSVHRPYCDYVLVSQREINYATGRPWARHPREPAVPYPLRGYPAAGQLETGLVAEAPGAEASSARAHFHQKGRQVPVKIQVERDVLAEAVAWTGRALP